MTAAAQRELDNSFKFNTTLHNEVYAAQKKQAAAQSELATVRAENKRLMNHIRELHGIGASEFPSLPEGFSEMKYKPYYYWRTWSRSRLADAGLLSILDEQNHDLP